MASSSTTKRGIFQIKQGQFRDNPQPTFEPLVQYAWGLVNGDPRRKAQLTGTLWYPAALRVQYCPGGSREVGVVGRAGGGPQSPVITTVDLCITVDAPAEGRRRRNLRFSLRQVPDGVLEETKGAGYAFGWVPPSAADEPPLLLIYDASSVHDKRGSGSASAAAAAAAAAAAGGDEEAVDEDEDSSASGTKEQPATPTGEDEGEDEDEDEDEGEEEGEDEDEEEEVDRSAAATGASPGGGRLHQKARVAAAAPAPPDHAAGGSSSGTRKRRRSGSSSRAAAEEGGEREAGEAGGSSAKALAAAPPPQQLPPPEKERPRRHRQQPPPPSSSTAALASTSQQQTHAPAAAAAGDAPDGDPSDAWGTPPSSGDVSALALGLRRALRVLKVGALQEWLFWRWAVAGGGSAEDVAAWCLVQWYCWRPAMGAPGIGGVRSLQDSLRLAFVRQADALAASEPPPSAVAEVLGGEGAGERRLRLPALPAVPDRSNREQMTLFVLAALEAIREASIIGRQEAVLLAQGMCGMGAPQLRRAVDALHEAWVAADPLTILWATADLLQ